MKKSQLKAKNRILDTIKEVYHEKGFKGYLFRQIINFTNITIILIRLFAGISSRVLMISFGGFIFFGAYEQTKSTLIMIFNNSGY